MLKALLILFFLVTGNSSVWADDLAMAAIATMPDVPVQKMLGGIVKSVSWSDPSKGAKSEIVVVDPDKKITNIYVSSTTTLWDADTKAIMREKILAKSKVKVIYETTPEGINIAKSIKILK